jgi:Xaa-Pro aminopeptidase
MTGDTEDDDRPSNDFENVRHRLDESEAFGDMRNTPYYEDAVYDTFSDEEFERRYRLTREKMDRRDLDALVVPGGKYHWSHGGAMLWLSGHWNWHSMVEYVVVPREGDPALVYSFGGTHAEATRQAVYPDDVRPSRGGAFGEVICEVLEDRDCADGTVGVTTADWRFDDYPPVNHVETVRETVAGDVELVEEFWHELLYRKSEEELEFHRKAGELAVDALMAIRDRAEPGVTEYDLEAAAATAAYEGGGQVDFLIIGSTPMDDPAQVFGNPRPSHRELSEGDIILNELAVGYEGYTAQIGIPVCVGEPTDRVREMFDEVTLPGFEKMEAELEPGNSYEAIVEAGEFFREEGYQSRPIHLHGIDIVSNSPHVGPDHVRAFDYEREMRPGAVVMLEPNPITADGLLGQFYGHTYAITEDGAERLTACPDELLVADW